MTTSRRDTREETPFGAWVRNQPALESHAQGLAVTDVDWIFHKYVTHVDRIGTRELRLMFMLEVKCYGARPGASQQETLSFLHQKAPRLGANVRTSKGQAVRLWDFGVYVLSLPHETPEEGTFCYWGRFMLDGSLSWRAISPEKLISVLSFHSRPDNGQRLEPRRHHLKEHYVVMEKTALGFEVETLAIRRS